VRRLARQVLYFEDCGLIGINSDIAADEPGNESEKQTFKERFQQLRPAVLQALRMSPQKTHSA
jgi:hypothetical protein